MPLSATLYLLAGPIQNWPGAAGHVAVFVAAALSISIFWSLQTLAYLHLRTAIDDVDANEIPSAKPVIQKPKPAEGDPSTPTTIAQQLWSTIQAAALLAATWFVTVWLFGRIGGANAGWLAWGMGEKFAARCRRTLFHRGVDRRILGSPFPYGAAGRNGATDVAILGETV